MQHAVTGTTRYAAKTADSRCTSCAQRMPGNSARTATQSQCGMWAAASAATSILLIQTGVSASVSLFVLLIALGNLLLVTLIGLLGLSGLLSLSGLTGLVVSVVGLIKGLAPGTVMGD
jgi:hypothetical protein